MRLDQFRPKENSFRLSRKLGISLAGLCMLFAGVYGASPSLAGLQSRLVVHVITAFAQTLDDTPSPVPIACEDGRLERVEKYSCPYFTQYMRKGDRDGETGQWPGQGTINEVSKLQQYFNIFFDEDVAVDGVYGQETTEAVHRFQGRFYKWVISPWVPPLPDRTTGHFYKTSRYMANFVAGCIEDKVFLEDPQIYHSLRADAELQSLAEEYENRRHEWVCVPFDEDLPECSDGIDNDGDGDIDYPEDRGCRNPEDDRERQSGGGGGGSNDDEDPADPDPSSATPDVSNLTDDGSGWTASSSNSEATGDDVYEGWYIDTDADKDVTTGTVTWAVESPDGVLAPYTGGDGTFEDVELANFPDGTALCHVVSIGDDDALDPEDEHECYLSKYVNFTVEGADLACDPSVGYTYPLTTPSNMGPVLFRFTPVAFAQGLDEVSSYNGNSVSMVEYVSAEYEESDGDPYVIVPLDAATVVDLCNVSVWYSENDPEPTDIALDNDTNTLDDTLGLDLVEAEQVNISTIFDNDSDDQGDNQTLVMIDETPIPNDDTPTFVPGQGMFQYDGSVLLFTPEGEELGDLVFSYTVEDDSPISVAESTSFVYYTVVGAEVAQASVADVTAFGSGVITIDSTGKLGGGGTAYEGWFYDSDGNGDPNDGTVLWSNASLGTSTLSLYDAGVVGNNNTSTIVGLTQSTLPDGAALCHIVSSSSNGLTTGDYLDQECWVNSQVNLIEPSGGGTADVACPIVFPRTVDGTATVLSDIDDVVTYLEGQYPAYVVEDAADAVGDPCNVNVIHPTGGSVSDVLVEVVIADVPVANSSISDDDPDDISISFVASEDSDGNVTGATAGSHSVEFCLQDGGPTCVTIAGDAGDLLSAGHISDLETVGLLNCSGAYDAIAGCEKNPDRVAGLQHEIVIDHTYVFDSEPSVNTDTKTIEIYKLAVADNQTGHIEDWTTVDFLNLPLRDALGGITQVVGANASNITDFLSDVEDDITVLGENFIYWGVSGFGNTALDQKVEAVITEMGLLDGSNPSLGLPHTMTLENSYLPDIRDYLNTTFQPGKWGGTYLDTGAPNMKIDLDTNPIYEYWSGIIDQRQYTKESETLEYLLIANSEDLNMVATFQFVHPEFLWR